MCKKENTLLILSNVMGKLYYVKTQNYNKNQNKY